MLRKFIYNTVRITTQDYGNGTAAGKDHTATLARIPDGSHYANAPSLIEVKIAEGELTHGDKVAVTFAKVTDNA